MGGRRDATRAKASDEPAVPAARTVLDAQVAGLARELGHARSGTVEGVHQLRVAARRVRTALTLFADRLPTHAAASLEREVRDLGRRVGTVRDIDVLAAALAKRSRKLDPALAPAAATLVRHVREHRATAHAVLASVLDGQPTRRLMARLGALIARTQPSSRSADTCAELVRPLVRAFERAARKADDDATPASRHRLRIKAKELRYALEMLGDPKGDAVRALVERLAVLQRRLGDERDAITQRAWLLREVPAFAGDTEALVTLGAVAEALRHRAGRAESQASRARRKVGAKRVKAALDELAAGSARRRAA
jgi:CHAD domain-containing protein